MKTPRSFKLKYTPPVDGRSGPFVLEVGGVDLTEVEYLTELRLDINGRDEDGRPGRIPRVMLAFETFGDVEVEFPEALVDLVVKDNNED